MSTENKMGPGTKIAIVGLVLFAFIVGLAVGEEFGIRSQMERQKQEMNQQEQLRKAEYRDRWTGRFRLW